MNLLMQVVGVFLVFVGIFILWMTWGFAGLLDPNLTPDQMWSEHTSRFFHSDGCPFGLAAIAFGIWFLVEGRRKPPGSAKNPAASTAPIAAKRQDR
jgi:hypothetical protein